MVADVSAGQQRRGRPFQPGQSGNPRGRPAGARNRVTTMLDHLAEADAADVLRAIIAKARAGDPRCADLVLSRIWPQRKGRAVTFDLPPLVTATDLSAALGIIATAIASGELTPEEGQSVAAVLEMQRRAIELVELETRVATLEAKRYGAGT
jgi:hypothetical protein